VTASQLSLVVLTEDGAQDGRATVIALVRRMLELVVPGCGAYAIEVLPSEPREEAAMPGNVWKTDGRDPVARDNRLRLLRYLARRLSQPDTYVFFHVDGDTRWQDQATSENVAKFADFAQVALPQVAGLARASVSRARGREPAPEPPPLHLDRLLLVCPFRSIEAWLFQNVRTAVEICRREHAGAHVEALQAWEGKRAQLDEEPAPELSTCLRKKWNLELATRGFPAQEAYDVEKSFFATVERLVACDSLTAALLRRRDAT
jgi:hypothetical protein